MMKKYMTMVLSLLLCLSLVGCGGQKASTLDIQALKDSMLAADSSLPDMQTVGSWDEEAESLFSYLSTLDYDKVNSYFLSYSSEGKADEIAVVELKSSSDVEDAMTTLNNHVRDRINLFRSYQPEQVSRAESAVITSKGNCVVLMICDNPSTVQTAFETGIAG